MVPVYTVSFADGSKKVYLSRKDATAAVNASSDATMQPGLGLTVWEDGATSASSVMVCRTDNFPVSGNQNFYSDDAAAS